MQVEGLDYTVTYASTRAFLNSALREEIYMEVPKGLLDLAASNKAIYKLLLKYGYNPSTPNIIKLSKALYGLKQSPREWQDKLKILLKSLGYLPLISDPGVFYNAKTCYFIVTYVDNCLFIGPDIGYITDLKKRLNKVYAIEDLGPATYFLGWLSRSLNRPIKSHLNAAKNLFKYLNSTKDYSICFSYNGNTVADLGPKLSNSSNITTKLSRDFHSKEGPRPLTTTSTTIVDSRNSKGSSRTSIINSSLVPIGFSNSDFAGDKATSKSTYGYLYKLAGGPISWKTKRATTIALSTLEAETNGLTEAIREVQWIIGLFSKLYRPIDYPITLYRDNQGSITVANDLALHARTKHTLLKFRYVREQVKAKIVTIIYLNTKSNVDSLFNLDNSVYDIPASILAKPAKIILAIRRTAAREAKQRKSAKAYTTAGRAAAAKCFKKEGLWRSKRTAGGNAGRYTTDSSLIANKDDNNAYNRAYVPPANTEEKEGSSSDDNSVNSSTSNSTNKGKGSGMYKRNKGTLHYKDILPHKR
ncbi:hypothetical protein P8C59_003936 [Phyllachora maydis]|uniref:Reverse transcriptase Ty1/copia-type domain-containing protein n=1 Tax=Phyllachora maydis TaxID=1825666 RepID=A0AAD9I2J1_9PEZI|nr:hypothetical protein P8C59_003936 [Phyllachora maydis]